MRFLASGAQFGERIPIVVTLSVHKAVEVEGVVVD